MNVVKTHYEAVEKAREATQNHLNKYGETLPCGFAWVVFRDARSKIVRELKKAGIGDNHWPRGWCIWNPSGNSTQNIDSKYAGAVAYVNHMRANGFECSAYERLD